MGNYRFFPRPPAFDVETLTVEENPDSFPAASNAATLYVYDVFGERLVSEKLVVELVPTSVVGEHFLPEHRYIL